MMHAGSARLNAARAATVSGSAGCRAIRSFQSWKSKAPDWPARTSSIPITIRIAEERIAAGSTVLASLVFETTTAQAPEFSMI